MTLQKVSTKLLKTTTFLFFFFYLKNCVYYARPLEFLLKFIPTLISTKEIMLGIFGGCIQSMDQYGQNLYFTVMKIIKSIQP